ncbi:hypothetical protein J2Z48_003071 [Croceifilum oryzae]|uniref:Uncharacterized protein n=1 Tax=Croceifilum oryzae TaxID=1553429 RepID=A0AAJ1TN16_9BACL|nr:hypothetical protein [Croceifilum oryzae]MDQ0418866.1 hypothetical protein [Croceifilum oryzae]
MIDEQFPIDFSIVNGPATISGIIFDGFTDFTIIRDGIYLMIYSANIDPASDITTFGISINGSPFDIAPMSIGATGGVLSTSTVRQLSVNDVIRFGNRSGGIRSITSGNIVGSGAQATILRVADGGAL